MELWAAFVGALTTLLLALSQAYGGNLGLAILTVSLVVRLALLPLTLKQALRARERQAKLKQMQPEIERLRERFGGDPLRLHKELTTLNKRHGVDLFSRSDVIGTLIQAPVFAGLYNAIRQGLGTGGRFLWIGDLARPDAALGVFTALLTYAAAALHPDLSPAARHLMTILPALVTLFVVGHLAAGLGLYCAATNAVNLLQSIILRRKLMQTT